MRTLWLTLLPILLMMGPVMGQVGGTASSADFDGDGVINSVDLDDDNDGILDTVESPGCFYTAAEAAKVLSVTSQIASYPGQNIANAYDGIVGNGSLVSTFATTNNNIAGVTIFQVTPAMPVAISSLNLYYAGNLFSNSVGSTMQLQGFDGTSWVNLSNPQSYNTSGTPNITIPILNTFQPTVKYQQYRVQGIAGSIGYSTVFEITLSVAASFNAQDYPKISCSPTGDADGDGFANYQDLDSDNDGCSDANEYYGLATADGGDGGVYGTGTPSVDASGKVSSASYTGSYGLATNASLKVCNASALPSCTPNQQLSQQRYWAFGNNAGIDFGASLNSPTPFVTSLRAPEGTAVATNSAGQLLFYVGDGLDYNPNDPSTLTSTIFKADGTVMPNGTGLLQHPSMGQGNVAYQSPGNPDKYFVIANNYAGEQVPQLGTLTYSVVDLCSQTVTQKNIVIDNSIMGEALTAVPSSDPTKFWVFVATNSTGQILAYEFDQNGYTGVKVTSTYLSTLITATRFLRLSPDGTKLLLGGTPAGTGPVIGVVNLYDFNAATGKVSLLWTMDSDLSDVIPYGGDFSPDGKLIYIAGITALYNRVYQFTIDGKSSGAQVLATAVNLGTSGGGGGQVARGPDGRMYVASYGQSSLGVINSPNVVGAGASFNPTGLALSGGTVSQYGLPQTAFGCSQPAARFSFNCQAGPTATGPFVANGQGGQTGTLTIPISVSSAGTIALTVSGSGFTTNPSPLIVLLSAGQTSMTIPVIYDGSGSAGVRNLTLTSPQTSGACSTTGSSSITNCVVPVTVFACPTITNQAANNTNPTSCNGSDGTIRICGLPANTTGHTVAYSKNSIVQPSIAGLTADATGCITLTNLGAGVYTNISVTNSTCTTGSNTLGPITLTNPNPPAAPTASATSQTICSGNQVTINYTTSPAGQQVAWTRMPDSLTGIGNVSDFPTATGTAPITYTYTASVMSFGCQSNTTTSVVTVNPIPVVTPSACSQTICAGQTGGITLTSNVGATINWLRVEDNATGTGNISQLFNTAGTYTYKIWGVSTATSCPSSATITSVIVVNNCCTLVASASASNTSVCPGGTATLGVAVSGNTGSVTYSWTGPNGFTSSLQNPSVTNIQASGDGNTAIYSVLVTDANSCTAVQTVAVAVQRPAVTISSNSPQCAGNTLSFSATSGMSSYSWTGPNGFASSQQNPSLPNATTAASGSYTLAVTNSTGCTASFVTSATIATQPSLTIAAGPSLTICSGQSTTLAVSGNNGSTITWTNSLGQTGTGTSIPFGPIQNLSTQPQSITYVVAATAGSCTDTKTVEVVINPAPVLQVVPSTAVYCAIEQISLSATATPNSATISWSRTPTTPGPSTGSGTGTVAVQQTLPAGNYVYSFTATGVNGCTSAVQNVPVTVQQ